MEKIYIVEENGGDCDGYWKHIYFVTLDEQEANKIKDELTLKCKQILEQAPENKKDDKNFEWCDYFNDNCHYMDRYSIVIKEYELNKTYNWYDSLPK